MNVIQFLGVYSGNLEIPLKKIDVEQIQYWFVWFMKKERLYIVSSKDGQVEIPSFFITAHLFETTFSQENHILFQEPTCPQLEDVQFYDQASAQTSIDSDRNTIQNNYQQNLNSIQSKHDAQNNESLAFLNPAEQALTNYNPASHDQSSIQKNDATLLPQSLECSETHHTSLPECKEEKQRENMRARNLDDEILQTLAETIKLWKEGEKEDSIHKIDALLERSDKYVKAHKHTFTKCAIQLRKMQEWDLALKFALRCVDISPDDSHVYFNVARIYFEEEAYKKASDYVRKALDLDFTCEAAHRLNAAISSKLFKVSAQ